MFFQKFSALRADRGGQLPGLPPPKYTLGDFGSFSSKSNFFDFFGLGSKKSKKFDFDEKDPKPPPRGIFWLKSTNLQEIAPYFHLKVVKTQFEVKPKIEGLAKNQFFSHFLSRFIKNCNCKSCRSKREKFENVVVC